jgi:ParB family chromosome partitioning protein
MENVKKKQEAGSKLKRTKKIVLGRGLDSLLPDIEYVESVSKEYFQCDIELIRPNRYQSRMQFSEDELEGMARSIKEQGIIQPLLVRKDDNGYELVTGERRLRAAKKAGLGQVPVIVKTITDTDLLEMSIVENVQREDLNPMEEAGAYYQLIVKFDLTQDRHNKWYSEYGACTGIAGRLEFSPAKCGMAGCCFQRAVGQGNGTSD